MHFTTLVSLIAVGAVAAPAGLSSKSLDLNTQIPYPTLPSRRGEAQATPSPASDILGGISKVREGNSVERRQENATEEQPSFRSFTAEQDAAAAKEDEAAEAEKDPLDDFLATFDDEGGKFNETEQDEALDTFNSDFEKRQADSQLDAYLASLDSDDEYDQNEADKLLGDYHSALDGEESTTSSTVASAEPTAAAAEAPKNETSSEMPATKNETSGAAPSSEGGFDVDALMDKAKAGAEAPKSETSAEPAPAKNETSSAASEPTAAPESSSSSPLGGLTGGLPVKRQELPDLTQTPEIPDLNDVTGSVIKRQAEDLEDADAATPAVEEKNVTTPAVDEKNATAASNETASSGFHGINEKLAKLNKLPIGGLPIKRQEGAPSDVNSPQPTGGKPATPESDKATSSLLEKYLVALGQPAGADAAPSKPAEKSNATAQAAPSEQKPESEDSSMLSGLMGEESEAPSAGGPPSEGAPAESEQKPESEESSMLGGLMGEGAGAPASAEPKGSNSTAQAAPTQEKPESEEDPLAGLLGEESKESKAPSASGPPSSESAPAAESSEAASSPLDGLMSKRQEVTEKHQSFVANTDEPAPAAPAPKAKSPAPKADDAGLDSVVEDLSLF